jgi:hypothetical protein
MNLLNLEVFSKLEIWTGEIPLEEQHMAIICKRGDNSGASAALEGDIQLSISYLH